METPIETKPASTGPNRRSRLAGIAGAGLIAGLMAVGVGGVAFAQDQPITVEPTVSAEAADVEAADAEAADAIEAGADVITVVVGEEGPDGEVHELVLSAEDEAVFDRFDQCLADNGLTEDMDEETVTEETIDAAFEACDPILDDLSDELQLDVGDWEDVDFEDVHMGDLEEGNFEAFEISDADSAVFDRFDTCLSENGVDGITEESIADEEIDNYMDAAFTACDPILDELSPELQDQMDSWEVVAFEGDLEGCGDVLEGEYDLTEEDGDTDVEGGTDTEVAGS